MPDVTKSLEKTHQEVNNLMKQILNSMGEELTTGAISDR